MYNNQNLKQTGTYGGNSMYASGQYGSGQTKQPANQSFMSQTGSSSAGYVGYGSVRSQSGASAGYSSASQAPSGGGYSSVSSTSANNAQQKPRQVIPKVLTLIDYCFMQFCIIISVNAPLLMSLDK